MVNFKLVSLEKLFSLLTKNERKRFLWIACVALLVGIVEVISVSSIMPLMSALGTPERFFANKWVQSIYLYTQIKSEELFLAVLCVTVFLFFICSSVIKGFATYQQLKYSHSIESSLSVRLMTLYMGQPYVWFLDKHTTDLGRKILTEVELVVNGALLPFINVMSQMIVAILLVTMLLCIEPIVALSVASIIAGSYALIYYFYRDYLTESGRRKTLSDKLRHKIISEAFGAIKEIKLLNDEKSWLKRYSLPAGDYARHKVAGQIVQQTPRMFIEAVSFATLLVVIMYLVASYGSLEGAIPVITLYGLASFRLIPAFQQIYGNISVMKYAGSSLDSISSDFKKLAIYKLPKLEKNEYQLHGGSKILFRNLCFSYNETDSLVINNLSLSLALGKKIGIVGPTGGGKSTLVDIILGLLEYRSGVVEIDGTQVTTLKNLGWQNLIGYVPQNIYLSDQSIMSNIAFGIDESDINRSAVIRAAQLANISEFIETSLEDGYNTVVGERGIRLSGGQRQRIGIARALYRMPKILILDEATSALDNVTERKVIEALEQSNENLTLIMVAHRLNTLKNCDQIFIVSDGKIADSGSYTDLLKNNSYFQELNSATPSGANFS